MVRSEKYLMHRLEVAEDATRRGLIKGSANRSRYLAELHKKAASGVMTESEHVAAAEARMAQIREEARLRLAGHISAAPRPDTGVPLGMVASAAEQSAGAARVRAEARQWRADAAARAARTQRRLANLPDGHALKAVQDWKRIGGSTG